MFFENKQQEQKEFSPSSNRSDPEIDSDTERLGILLENRLLEEPLLNNENEAPVQETKKSRKYKRNIGQTYSTHKGKVVPAKIVKLLYPCKKNCKEKISPELQEQIFLQYWSLANFNLRIAFVSGLITVQDKKVTRNVKSVSAPRNREYSYCYFLNINGQRTQVCKICFKATLGETDRFLKTVISKKVESQGTVTSQDLRGKAAAINKISEERLKEVRDHIQSFPAYESHYSRKHSSQKFLPADLNLSTMFKLYSENTSQSVSLSKYSEIFHSFSLKFKRPHVDTCSTCDEFKLKISIADGEDLNTLLTQRKEHHEHADRAYESKKADIAAASPTSKILVFDLQQCLPTPYLRSNKSFYKRQLNTFNLTVHDCNTGKYKE